MQEPGKTGGEWPDLDSDDNAAEAASTTASTEPEAEPSQGGEPEWPDEPEEPADDEPAAEWPDEDEPEPEPAAAEASEPDSGEAKITAPEPSDEADVTAEAEESEPDAETAEPEPEPVDEEDEEPESAEPAEPEPDTVEESEPEPDEAAETEPEDESEPEPDAEPEPDSEPEPDAEPEPDEAVKQSEPDEPEAESVEEPAEPEAEAKDEAEPEADEEAAAEEPAEPADDTETIDRVEDEEAPEAEEEKPEPEPEEPAEDVAEDLASTQTIPRVEDEAEAKEEPSADSASTQLIPRIKDESEDEPAAEPESEDRPAADAASTQLIPRITDEPEDKPEPAEADSASTQLIPKIKDEDEPKADSAATQFIPKIKDDEPEQPDSASTQLIPKITDGDEAKDSASTQLIPRITDKPAADKPRPAETTQHIAKIEPEPADSASTQLIPRITEEPQPGDTQVFRAVRPSTDDLRDTQFISVVRDEPVRNEPTPSGPFPSVPAQPERAVPQRVGPIQVGEPAAATVRSRGWRKKPVLISAGAVLVVLVVLAGVLISSPSARVQLGLSAPPTTTTGAIPSPVAFTPLLAPLTGSGAEPTATGVGNALNPLAKDPALGVFAGSVMDATTGQTLWSANPGMAMTPASTNKVLTSAAALLSLDPLSTLDTTVLAGTEPGTVVLVGGGDPTLNSLPAPQQTVYPGSARLDDLVAQVKQAHPGAITQVVVDASAYTGPTYGPGWSQGPTENDYSQVVPAMLDGGRRNGADTSDNGDNPRIQNPSEALGLEFAKRLGSSTSSVTVGTAPTTGQVLGVVHSAIIQNLVANLLTISDNMLAEALGRAVAKADHQPESFAGAATAVRDVLQRNGFNVTGLNLGDSSGLSPQDAVPPALLAQVLRVAAEPDGSSDPRVAKLRPLLAGLPVAGGTGTLSDRFAGGASGARGWVRAKTGTLTDQFVNTLAGVVQDANGQVLVFALMSGVKGDNVRAPIALDNLAAALRGCGCTG